QERQVWYRTRAPRQIYCACCYLIFMTSEFDCAAFERDAAIQIGIVQRTGYIELCRSDGLQLICPNDQRAACFQAKVKSQGRKFRRAGSEIGPYEISDIEA